MNTVQSLILSETEKVGIGVDVKLIKELEALIPNLNSQDLILKENAIDFVKQSIESLQNQKIINATGGVYQEGDSVWHSQTVSIFSITEFGLRFLMDYRLYNSNLNIARSTIRNHKYQISFSWISIALALVSTLFIAKSTLKEGESKNDSNIKSLSLELKTMNEKLDSINSTLKYNKKLQGSINSKVQEKEKFISK